MSTGPGKMTLWVAKLKKNNVVEMVWFSGPKIPRWRELILQNTYYPVFLASHQFKVTKIVIFQGLKTKSFLASAR